MILWSLQTEDLRLNGREIIFEVLRRIWSRYLNVTDTFCEFCGIYSINDLESRILAFIFYWACNAYLSA